MWYTSWMVPVPYFRETDLFPSILKYRAYLLDHNLLTSDSAIIQRVQVRLAAMSGANMNVDLIGGKDDIRIA